ncbi:MAG: SPOR domain-containing protein [Tabrizicola sp.]|uniref:SPOR domain-containing protein n=1 Tax=Tabrizicola sp. TaxID=2005166 RepID=UPI002ABAFBA2|nr:SPOR domain-containing protein [Tabrizicola sp.]MDZ4086919.1 SPOR domain-containing protein [Tabrizicola sp.]
MADADYDFGGGYSHREEPLRQGARPALDARKVQRSVNIAGAVTSLGLVVGLGVWGYQLAVRDVRGVPVIQAMDGPMRIAPADPGGEIADHQGLAVNAVAAVGIAAPPPEKLVLAPRPVELAPEDTAGLGATPMPGLEEASAPVSALTANADLALAAAPPTESATPTEVAVDAALAEALGEIPVEDPVADTVALELPSEPAPEGAITVSIRPKARPGARSAAVPVAEAAQTLPAPTEVDPATLTPGTRLVQFGTFDTAEEARAEWSRLQGRFGELMAAKAMVVQPAESGGRTFYRLRAHGFEGEDDARRFCSAFVTEDAVCIPVPHK